MRISDWSSDVCSSDLLEACCTAAFTHTQVKIFTCCDAIFIYHCGPPLLLTCWRMCCERARRRIRTGCSELLEKSGRMAYRTAARRSEEHTSELQSLMRSSYAVFCLKKKKKQNNKKQIAYRTAKI